MSRSALVVAAVAVLAAAYLTWQPPQPQTSSAAPAQPRATTTAARMRHVAWRDEFSGRIEAVGGVEVRSRVAGTVEAVHFKPGDLVHKGEALFSIAAEPYAAEVDRAERALAVAQARHATTGAELHRAQRLLDKRALAQRPLRHRQQAHDEAHAALQRAQAALDSARTHLGHTRISAPISGRVGRAEVRVGHVVEAGEHAPALTSIVSLSPIYATAQPAGAPI